jgi:hypothetical protein
MCCFKIFKQAACRKKVTNKKEEMAKKYNRHSHHRSTTDIPTTEVQQTFPPQKYYRHSHHRSTTDIPTTEVLQTFPPQKYNRHSHHRSLWDCYKCFLML